MNMTKDISLEDRAKWQVPAMDIPLWLGKQHSYCVVIPVINEGERIKSLLKRMEANQIAAIADIIIVDGGSTDGSLVLEELQRVGVRGLVVKKGPGKLSAQLRCAYAYALDQGYEGIVTIDGNDKDDPEAIPKFINALVDGVDFVQASRFLAGGIAENTPKSRDFAIRYIHAPALSLSSGFKWTDTTQGFRAYSRKMLLDSSIAPFRDIFNEYELLAYLSHRAPKLNYRCVEIATTRRYPLGEIPTKISAVRGNFRVLRTLFSACFGRYDSSDTIRGKTLDNFLILSLIATGFIFSILTFFPGWMSPDSFAQYSDAKRGLYSDWHPVLLAWWWRQLDKIYQGPALLLIQNLLMYWSAWGLLAVAGCKWIGRYAYLIPLLGFWPGLLYPLGQIWKDISFACAVFLAWAIMINAYTQARKLIFLEKLGIFALATFAFGVKTNGLVVLPFLFGFMVHIEGWKKTSFLKQAILALCLTLAAIGFAQLAVSEKKIIKTNPIQYTQTYDLLAISVKTDENLLPPYIVDRIGGWNDRLKELYFSGGNNLLFYNTAGNLLTTNPAELDDLNKRWINAIKESPLQYFEHRWENFKSLLRIKYNFAAVVAFPAVIANEYGFVFVDNSFSRWLAGMPDTHPVMFFHWIYLAALAACSLLAFARAKKHRPLILLTTGSAFAFVLPHFFIAPAADYRYLYYSAFVAMVMILISVIGVTEWLRGLFSKKFRLI